jgi:hypothetical protein
MSGTIICPNCNGNGYVGNSKKKINKMIVLLARIKER